MISKDTNRGIPISVILKPALEAEGIKPNFTENKKRLLTISILAIGIGIASSLVAKVLMHLIYFITDVVFYGETSWGIVTPANTTLGLWIILIPTVGGLIVGLMAFYGSKAIRGHGIPEAMEQILINQSKIKPNITYLKPISSAIAIGTGGPFGAEGPIIATGGALGSTLGQILKVTTNERKILLAAGASSGMAAVFGSPIAGIFLAIELLLFEFSPRSIIPVALACITGAAGHHFLFSPDPIFPVGHTLSSPSNHALFIYSLIGIVMGFVSIFVTKVVYFFEDVFSRLPIHWMWWPAIGGLAAGIFGYFSPRTLGAGYENITDLLSGALPLKVILALCFLKFFSWAISLSSGTSGGTLAPLLTIGGATGSLFAMAILYYFPNSGITISMTALVCMSALFAGASRALLTSIVFALEVTGEPHAMLPLLAACTASYFISFSLMKDTIMTEKISRRGIQTPDQFQADVLQSVMVKQVMSPDEIVIEGNNTIGQVRDWLKEQKDYQNNYFIIATKKNEFIGIISSSNLFSDNHPREQLVSSLIKRSPVSVMEDDNLKIAVDLMAEQNIDILPVISNNNNLIGIISYRNILNAYKKDMENDFRKDPSISLRKSGMKILIEGRKLIDSFKRSDTGRS